MVMTLLILAFTFTFFIGISKSIHSSFPSLQKSPLLSLLFSLLTYNHSITAPLPSPAENSSATDGSTAADLRRVFSTFDRNGDGRITESELRESLENLGIFMSETDVSSILQKMDADGDGSLDLEEFCVLHESVMCGSAGVIKVDELKEAFDVFDENGDGFITVEELRSVLGSLGLKEGMKDCEGMIGKVDVDGDGRVDFSEFTRMMMNQQQQQEHAYAQDHQLSF